jgi:hypothetical protein
MTAPHGQTGKVQMGAKGENPEAPGEVHTVVKGDTLWDLSQKFLGSPWYWPKVWSYNPQIANPHWIYPGNQVKFFSGGAEQAPSRIEVQEGGQAAPAAQAEEEVPEPKSEETTNDDVVPMSALSPEDNEVHLEGRLVPAVKPGFRYTQSGFVTADEVAASGSIRGSFSESVMLAPFDIAYLDFKSKDAVRSGDRYLIFRKERQLLHPVTHQPVGWVTRILGSVRVDSAGAVKGSDTETSVVRARVMEVWDDIRRGDLIGPYGEHVRMLVNPRPNTHSLRGYVVGGLASNFVLIGEHALVVIDKGRDDGVEQGNTFTFTRRGDPASTPLDPVPNQSPDYPEENIGACMALEVKSTATTCVVTRSLRDIVPGDHVVMVPEKVGVVSK